MRHHAPNAPRTGSGGPWLSAVHLVDDTGLGGVNRWLDAQLPRLAQTAAHRRLAVDPAHDVPPALAADVIVIHFTTSWRKLAWLHGLRLRNAGAHFILVEHSYTPAFEALHVRRKARFRALLRLTYGLMHQVVAVSAAQGAWLLQAASLPPGKLSVIHPVTALGSLRALPPPLPRPAGSPLRVCGYGRYTAQKGFDTLVEAMRLVAPAQATLRLVGFGPEETRLRGLAEGLPHVCVAGPVPGPAALFGEVDAVAVPSRFEAFGCVGIEARAAALPVILSDADGLRDQAVPAPELRVAAGDPGALARAIIWLAGQDLAPLGAAARHATLGAEGLATAAWRRVLLRACQASALPEAA